MYDVIPLPLADGLKPLLTPNDCLCPSENYTCLVNSGIAIAWQANTVNRDNLALSQTDDAKELHVEEGGFQVTLRKVQENFTSTLHVRDLGLNKTDLTCDGVYITEMGLERINVTSEICVVGKLSLYLFFCPVITDMYIRSSLPSH